MKLEIKGYKNIQSLSYDCQDKAINFIFGISGSGKSSIPEALTDPNPIENKTFGFSGSQLVLINGQTPDKYSIKSFKMDSPEKFIGQGSEENMQEILIDDSSKYETALYKLNEMLKDLETARNACQPKQQRMSDMLKKLGASKLTKANKISSTSPLSKVLTAVTKMSDSKTYKEIESMEKGKYPWVLEGIGYIHDEKCPFCYRHISKTLSKKLSRFQNYEEKSVSSINSQAPIYASVTGSSTSNTLASLKQMAKDVIILSVACKDFEKLNQFIDILYETSSNESMIQKFLITKEFRKYFFELVAPINKLNRHIGSLINVFKKAKEKTSDLLKNRSQKINRILCNFGIPYLVSAKYNKNRVNDYRLIHRKDTALNDDGERLSNGEKFVVSLIFFILQVKKQQPDLVIFDDPVSSYDDYRRKQLIDLIASQLSSHTILILSHDTVFAKYAIFEKKSGNKKIGNIDYLEHFGPAARFTPIQDGDFVVYSDSVKERIPLISNYYLRMVSLRTLYEGKYGSLVYQYLSSIVHCFEPAEIHKLLTEKGTTEEEILGKMKKDLSLPQDLPSVFSDYYKQIDTNNISIFEKGLLLREYMEHHPNIERCIKKELDDYIHLNNRLHLCLNPYAFPFCTQKVFDYVSDNIKGIIDIK